ncbi:MAG: aldo/keto reductase family protein [Anaerolineales bacterium]|nr:aldo/keto reductase family protein [Anaerolineales bacterium]
MEYRQLGQWGPKVSVLGVGSYLTLGLKTNEAESRAIVRRAFEAGVNFFDTANAYNRGGAEEVLGRCLAEFPRSDYVLITKVWAPMGPGPNDRGLSAKHIREQCRASLKRLGLDYVDVYMCHRPDPQTPLEETLRALDDLARAGDILYWGVSEWPAWLIVKAQALARELRLRPLIVNQPRYSLLYRYPEFETFPVTRQEGVGNVVFSPLAHGLLTGKYAPGAPAPAGTRAADPDQNAVMLRMYWTEENQRRGRQLAELAAAHGTTAARLALAWAMRPAAVSSVILGVRTLSQLDDNLHAADLKLDPGLIAAIEAIYPPPPFPPQA